MEIALKGTLSGQLRLWICPWFRYKPHKFKHMQISAHLQGPKWRLLPSILSKEMCPALSQAWSTHFTSFESCSKFIFCLENAVMEWGWQMPLPICQNQEEFFNHFNDALFAAETVCDHFLYSRSLLNDILTSFCQQNLLSNHLCFSLSQIVLTRFAARDLIFSFYQQSKIRSH